jgi:hypothetical protein
MTENPSAGDYTPPTSQYPSPNGHRKGRLNTVLNLSEARSRKREQKAAQPKAAQAKTGQAGTAQARTSQRKPGLPSVRIGSPASMLAVVPHLLGFVPQSSLVVIGAGPPRGRVHVTLRFDLPDPPDEAASREIAAHAAAVLARERLRTAIVIGYGPEDLVSPLAGIVRGELSTAGLDLKDVLRAEDGRYWSYVCGNPACCPAEGVPFDGPAHPAAEVMATEGKTVLADRAALAATIAPVGGLARQSMRQATLRAEQHAVMLLAQASRSGRERAARRLVTSEGLSAVSEAIETYRRGGKLASDDQVAWLSVALADLRVRDDAWARMDPGWREAHRRLWVDLLRRAEPPYVPAPAALLAFTAWQSGDGALANVALDRALDADPGYSMAQLLREAIDCGAPPSMARLPMTPEEVAESYTDPDEDRDEDREDQERDEGDWDDEDYEDEDLEDDEDWDDEDFAAGRS